MNTKIAGLLAILVTLGAIGGAFVLHWIPTTATTSTTTQTNIGELDVQWGNLPQYISNVSLTVDFKTYCGSEQKSCSSFGSVDHLWVKDSVGDTYSWTGNPILTVSGAAMDYTLNLTSGTVTGTSFVFQHGAGYVLIVEDGHGFQTTQNYTVP